MRSRLVRAVAVAGVLALLLAVVPAAGSAAPGMHQMRGTVSWTPGRVFQVAPAGTEVGVDVELVSTRTMSNTIIVATPSLRDWVTITPSEPMTLTAGVTITVHLSITVPAGKRGARGGTIKVKSEAGNTIPRPLPVMIRVKNN